MAVEKRKGQSPQGLPIDSESTGKGLDIQVHTIKEQPHSLELHGPLEQEEEEEKGEVIQIHKHIFAIST